MLGSRRRLRRRIERECRPLLDHASGGSAALEPRVLLNASPALRLPASRTAEHVSESAASSSHHRDAKHASKRLTPAQKINQEYANFTTAFNNVLANYAQSINEESTGQLSVSTTVQGNYSTPPLPSTILVADAAVFGPEGDFSSPVTATALLGSATLGTVYITGSSGNYLIITPASGTATTLPTGTVLAANVPTSAQSSAQSIFPSYITNSTIQMAISLVQYFNNVPIKLPPKTHRRTRPCSAERFSLMCIRTSPAAKQRAFSNCFWPSLCPRQPDRTCRFTSMPLIVQSPVPTARSSTASSKSSIAPCW